MTEQFANLLDFLQRLRFALGAKRFVGHPGAQLSPLSILRSSHTNLGRSFPLASV
jgi:hypothetical protein